MNRKDIPRWSRVIDRIIANLPPDHDERINAILDRERNVSTQRYIQNARLPFSMANFKEFRPRGENNRAEAIRLFEHVKNLTKDRKYRKSIMITGDKGNGKTYFSCCSVIKVIKSKRWLSLYVNMKDEFERICKSEINSDFPENISEARDSLFHGKCATIKRMQAADFLVMDDMGVEEKFTKKFIYQVINHRYENRKPTIFASLFSIAELEKNGYGDIADRMRAMCGGNEIIFVGKSYRYIENHGEENAWRFDDIDSSIYDDNYEPEKDDEEPPF